MEDMELKGWIGSVKLINRSFELDSNWTIFCVPKVASATKRDVFLQSGRTLIIHLLYGITRDRSPLEGVSNPSLQGRTCHLILLFSHRSAIASMFLWFSSVILSFRIGFVQFSSSVWLRCDISSDRTAVSAQKARFGHDYWPSFLTGWSLIAWFCPESRLKLSWWRCPRSFGSYSDYISLWQFESSLCTHWSEAYLIDPLQKK